MDYSTLLNLDVQHEQQEIDAQPIGGTRLIHTFQQLYYYKKEGYADAVLHQQNPEIRW